MDEFAPEWLSGQLGGNNMTNSIRSVHKKKYFSWVTTTISDWPLDMESTEQICSIFCYKLYLALLLLTMYIILDNIFLLRIIDYLCTYYS